MIEALIAGEKDVTVLADLAQRQLRGKIPELKRALEGELTEHHCFLLRQLLGQYDFLEKEIESVSETTEVALKRYHALGSEDVYKHLSSGLLYSFEIAYQPISSALIRYGTQAQGGGAGTIDKSLSFLYSEDIDGVENYVFYKGARCDQVSVEITSEAVKVSQNFICREITTPATSHGLTTPTFAPANSAAPWTGADGGTNPFIHNSNSYDVDMFKFTVSRGLTR